MAYRLAASLIQYRAECNLKWPGRDKSSDGWIGDAAHASRSSDHNPWVKDNRGIGVVRAYDLDGGPGMSDPIGLWVAEFLRAKGKAGGFPPLGSGSYVISNYRIADASSKWNWVPYHGSNPHNHHTHVSVALSQSQYDYRGTWGLAGQVSAPPAAAPTDTSTLQLGSKGPAVVALQKVLNRWYPSLPALATDGDFGPATQERVKYFQSRAGLVSDGVVGAKTKAVLHL